MPRYAAFLRAMNVGGRRLTNDELLGHVADLGYENSGAFLASGNLVFDSGRRTSQSVTRHLGAGLTQALGYDVSAIVRTFEEVGKIASASPFGESQAGGKPQVILLAETLSTEQRANVESLSTPDDQLCIVDREIHWLPSGGLMDSALDFKTIERTVGLNTVRTKRTIERLWSRFSR